MKPVPTDKPGRLRWGMVGLAFLATVINYLDRQTLSVVGPELRKLLGFGDIEYSRIVFAFMLAYTISNGISGPLIDRLGTRWGYAVCMAWWSAAGAMHAFAGSALSLGVFRFLLGLGEAGNWPAAIKLVSEWFAPKERAMASGVFNSGSAIGAVVAAPLTAWLALRFGWQQAFLWVGMTGFAWLALWLSLYRTPKEAVVEVSAPPPPAWTLLRQRFVLGLTLCKILFDPCWYFYIFWFPQFLSSVHHFDLAKIGMYGWIPFLTADLGNFAGGGFSAFLLRRGVPLDKTRRAGLWLFAALMAGGIPAVLVSSPWLAIAFISTATFGYTGCLVNMLALPGDRYPRNALGSVWGLASMGSGFGGMLFALITGWVVANYSYGPVFFGFGMMPLISVVILLKVAMKR